VRHVDDADAVERLAHVILPMGVKRANSLLPGNFCEISARCPAESRTNTRQTRNPDDAGREFFTGAQGIFTERRELFALGREFNPVIGNFSEAARLHWPSQEI